MKLEAGSPALSAAPGCKPGTREERRYNSTCRPGDRGPEPQGRRCEESPDTAGQGAGEIPGGESRRKVAQKGDRHRRTSSPETPAVRVKRWGKSPPASW